MSAPKGRASIEVQEATEQNLRSLSCTIPRTALTVVTGPSGSGKSSLVFGVLYGEALGRKPRNALAVSGLPPAVAIGHELRAPRVRGSVATVTGLYDLLRALYLREGEQRCPHCGARMELHTAESILEGLRSSADRFISVLTPFASGSIEALIDRGISRGWIDGRLVRLADLDADSINPALWIVEDIITPQARGREPRLRESIARAIDGDVAAITFAISEHLEGEGRLASFALKPVCGGCGATFTPLGSEQFEFWNTAGACTACAGKGALPAPTPETYGLSFVPEEPCPRCEGTRIRPEVGAIRLAGLEFSAVLKGSLATLSSSAGEWAAQFTVGLSAKIVAPLRARLSLLTQLGVEYLPLSREISTLSGGELQRLRLAVDLSKPLGGLLYLIDEPTTGLHSRDTARVVGACKALVAKGSTIIAVEHDPEFIAAADHVLELGPGSGIHGGALVAAAPIDAFLAGSSPTALALKRAHDVSPHRRGAGERFLVVRNLHRFSLQHIDLHIPLKRLVGIAGVSGSGKSTAIQRTVVPLVEYLLRNRTVTGEALTEEARQLFMVDSVTGAAELDAVVDASQIRPYLGSRSTVASAAGVLTPLRELFARTIDARTAGLSAREFSYFSPTGWCERCEGRGVSAEVKVAPELAAPCEACHGTRLSHRARSIRYRGKSIDEVLGLTVEEAALLYRYVPRLRLILPRLVTIGLGYLRLSQATRSLSRGEQQRLRLLPYIGRASSEGGTLLVFDEPTRGLHLDEVAKLVSLLRALVAQGNSVIVIEHNRELLRAADHVIEFGPGAGDEGGRILQSDG